MENKKFIITLVSSALAVFLGAFLAFWIVFGHIKNDYNVGYSLFPKVMAMDVNNDYARQVDKIFENQRRAFDQMNNDFDKLMKTNIINDDDFIINKNATSIKTEDSKDAYKITVDLKPFNNDEKNVNVKVKGRTISISAQYQDKGENEFNSSNFYQSLTLPSKLNLKEIKQEKVDSSLVITIPKIVKEVKPTKEKI